MKSKKHTFSFSFRHLLRGRSGSYLLFAAFIILATLLVYLGAKPRSYNLNVSDASPYDIEAPRSFIDYAATNKRAAEAAAQVPNKLTVSEEITSSNLTNCRSFIEICRKNRKSLYWDRLTEEEKDRQLSYKPNLSEQTEAEVTLLAELKQHLDIDFSEEDIKTLIAMSETRFDVFRNNFLSIADLVMGGPVDSGSLQRMIRQESEKVYESESFYQSDQSLIVNLLGDILRANVIYNKEATDNARNDAYNRIQQNPIMINRGTRIVSEGDIITTEIYNLLRDVDLIESEDINWRILGGEALLVLLLSMIVLAYFRHYQKEVLTDNRQSLALALSILIPLLISAYLGQRYQLSPPVYFTAVVISSYFGFETSLLLSICMIAAVMPIVNFNPAFLLVGLTGSAVAALFAQGISNQDNFAKLILATALSNLITSSSFSLMQGNALPTVGFALMTSVISGVGSVIAAIGCMPLFELIFNTVSPMRLIELSQPGHPLMRRLFLEAPGTSQHSMMVANLADAAAEAIGANAMICRVGAYYHDIGKLENPIMFTENQLNYNPHDFMKPEESAAIITKHTLDGIKLGRKYRLPQQVLCMAREHHGTTVLQYFYNKAAEQAKKQQLPPPDPDDFRYSGPTPGTKESAIVMLADSTEAAVKSSRAQSLEEAEKMMRQVFKIKNDQNQLNRSGLSYAEVDKILEAFLQVYAGNFHERVRYSDAEADKRNSQSTEKV